MIYIARCCKITLNALGVLIGRESRDVGVGDGGGQMRGTFAPEKFGKSIFGKIMCKIRAFCYFYAYIYRAMSCRQSYLSSYAMERKVEMFELV